MKEEVLIKVECIDLSFEGKGVCKSDGVVIFVENMLPGEIALVKITDIKKRYMSAGVVEYIKTSNDRVLPSCKYYTDCGGCNITHMSDKLKREVKLMSITNLINKSNLNINIVDMMDNINDLEYRNKITMHIQKKKNKIYSGLYKHNTHEVCTKYCDLVSKKINDINNLIINLLEKYEVDIYDKNTNLGSLYEIVYKSYESKLMIIFKLYREDKNLKNVIIKISELEDVTSIYVFSKETVAETLVYGDKFINTYIDNVEYKLSPSTFFQVNSNVASKMFSKIVEISNFSKNDNIIDCYCGVGAISLYIANHVNNVIGIDINSKSIENANMNKEINSISNASFICGDVEKEIRNIQSNIDYIIIDPPRKGCDKKFLDFIIDQEFDKIIYMSCSPNSLIKDLEYLSNSGYFTSEVFVYDMFPQTTHVESLCIISKV